MNKETYLELGKTKKGRAKAHDLMLNEIREKMDDLVFVAAPTKQPLVKSLFDNAYEKVSKFGNAILFDYFADDKLKPSEFVKNTDRVNRGDFVEIG